MDWNSFWAKVWEILSAGGVTLLKLIGVFILGYIIIRLIKRIVKNVLKKTKMDALAQKFLLNAMSFVLYFSLVLILIQTAGIAITGLLTAIAAAGLAVALALQDALTSLANGIILVLTKPFKANDSIEINGISGKVKSVNFFNTIIDTWDNRRIIIPNKNMIGYTIENTNFHAKRRFSFSFKIGHSANFTELKRVILDAIISNKNVFTDPMPEVRLNEFGDSGMNIEVRAWTISDSFDSVKLEVIQTVYNEIKKANFELSNNSLIIYSENRPEKFVDPVVLPTRDVNVQPEITRTEQVSFEKYLDDLAVNNVKKLSRKNRKNKKNT